MKIDTKAQLIIADLVVYIIVFMIIIAIITTLTIAFDRKESEIINNQEYDMIAQNTINALIKSTGTPTNWDKTPTSNIKMIGLRSNETTNMISYIQLITSRNGFRNYLGHIKKIFLNQKGQKRKLFLLKNIFQIKIVVNIVYLTKVTNLMNFK